MRQRVRRLLALLLRLFRLLLLPRLLLLLLPFLQTFLLLLSPLDPQGFPLLALALVDSTGDVKNLSTYDGIDKNKRDGKERMREYLFELLQLLNALQFHGDRCFVSTIAADAVLDPTLPRLFPSCGLESAA